MIPQVIRAHPKRFVQSEQMLARALKSTPSGSQTVAKSFYQYPVGAAPLFLKKGKGSRVWDVDGNEYIDFISSLATSVLGYGDEEVLSAVRAQLEDGVGFSLPHPLEHEVAEIIVEMVPCAQSVRFFKNGADATAAAVRLARAFTQRDHVATCGYHGWQDWCMANSPFQKGIPGVVQSLSHTFSFNDLSSLRNVLEGAKGEFAAVVLEPMNITEPDPDFLVGVKELAEAHGAILIFDEVITGFRFAKGGAQELFGVTPHLAAFAKAMSNGFPLSALAGRADIMSLLDNDVFVSTTHGGEALSLAAAKATLSKINSEPVVETLHSRGSKAFRGIRNLIEKYGLADAVDLLGHPTYFFLKFRNSHKLKSQALQSLFLQEVFASGILAFDKHWVNYSHSDQDIEELLAVYDHGLAIVAHAAERGNITDLLGAQIIDPRFVL